MQKSVILESVEGAVQKGGYRGERIKIGAVLEDIAEAARHGGWEVEWLPAGPAIKLMALRRMVPSATRKVYLSAGIHGDEPAGPLAALRLLRENLWPADTGLWLCPCLNPTGFPTNRRESDDGLDLNRDYRNPQSQEIRAHLAWLERQPRFDAALSLHEDWEAAGFYLYELNPEGRPSLAEKFIKAVKPICAIDPAPVIEGREARGGIIRPDLNLAARPKWPEAFYLIQHKTPLSYTLEAPSSLILETRVKALWACVRVALTSPPAVRA